MGKIEALAVEQHRSPGKLDTITVEVVRHKLEGIANEMESTLLRSSFSPIVKEGLDALDEPEAATDPGDPVKGMRPILVTGAREFVPAQVLDRGRMAAGFTFRGPAVIEQSDTTTLVEPGWRGHVDAAGNVILEREEK